jgi:hypothetical protein
LLLLSPRKTNNFNNLNGRRLGIRKIINYVVLGAGTNAVSQLTIYRVSGRVKPSPVSTKKILASDGKSGAFLNYLLAHNLLLI